MHAYWCTFFLKERRNQSVESLWMRKSESERKRTYKRDVYMDGRTDGTKICVINCTNTDTHTHTHARTHRYLWFEIINVCEECLPSSSSFFSPVFLTLFRCVFSLSKHLNETYFFFFRFVNCHLNIYDSLNGDHTFQYAIYFFLPFLSLILDFVHAWSLHKIS